MRRVRNALLFAVACSAAWSACYAQDAALFPGQKGGQDTFGHYTIVADWRAGRMVFEKKVASKAA